MKIGGRLDPWVDECPLFFIGIESTQSINKELSFIDGPEDMKAYEYSVLITDRKDIDLTSIFHFYRDRADCENNIDELKNR